MATLGHRLRRGGEHGGAACAATGRGEAASREVRWRSTASMCGEQGDGRRWGKQGGWAGVGRAWGKGLDTSPTYL
jgi:hypothetical protein